MTGDHLGTNAIGATLAVGGGVVVAVSDAAASLVAQTNIVGTQGQMTAIGLAISFIGLLTAGLPHAYRSIELMYADRRHRREVEKAERDRSERTAGLVNDLADANARLVELEKIAATNEELKRTAETVEVRYEESQAQIGRLEAILAKLVPAVAENQDDHRRVFDAWLSRTPPELTAVVNPAPLPQPQPPAEAT